MIGGLSGKGSTEEFEFWANLGVDFMMLSVAYDFFLDDKLVSDVLNFRDRFKVNLLFHPRPDGQFMQSPANPDAHSLMYDVLDRIRELIQRHDLINKIILHLTTCRIPVGNYKAFTEEEAIIHSHKFYQQFPNFDDVTFVFENVYPPGIGWDELGYRSAHFSLFDLPKNSEFCLDTGHLKLSSLRAEDILNLPLEVTCLHLHSNDGTRDQHVPLTQGNHTGWKHIEALLSSDKYMVLEVKRKLETVPQVLAHLKLNKIAP